MNKVARMGLVALLLAGTSLATLVPFNSAVAGSSATASEEKGPDISSFLLKNGMQVVVIPDHRASVVTHMVWYKAGSADELPGKSGIAHYLEHLMFKGTKTVKAGVFSSRVAEIGGQENAFTSTDYTAYYQRVTPQVLEEMMRFEADRMENLILSNEVIDPERSVVLEERNSRIENRPSGLFGEAMSAALYRNHRYGVPIIGWRHEIEKLGKDDAIEFYNKYYTPNNAILVVAGDVEASEVLAMAQKTYGKVARRAEPGKRMRPAEPPTRAPHRIAMTHERVRTPSLRRNYLASSYHNSNDGEELDILGEILGGGSTSRIYRALVVDQKIATSAGAYYQGGSLDDTSFGLYATPAPDKSLDDVENALDAQVALLLKDGITEIELKRAKSRLVKSAIFARDSQVTLARIYGATLAVDGTIKDVQSWSDDIRTVKLEDVNAVARKYLDLKRSVTGTLSPVKMQKEG